MKVAKNILVKNSKIKKKNQLRKQTSNNNKNNKNKRKMITHFSE